MQPCCVHREMLRTYLLEVLVLKIFLLYCLHAGFLLREVHGRGVKIRLGVERPTCGQRGSFWVVQRPPERPPLPSHNHTHRITTVASSSCF